jgi:antibiotic biosynthesis monooxygenase (ABM) superfamily enzyme
MMAVPVTTIIRVTPVKGKELQLLAWFNDIASDAASFEGHQGSELFQTVTAGGQQWLSLFAFDTWQHLDAWQQSAVRARHLAVGAVLFDEQVRREQMVGIEFWFADRGRLKPGPPPRWKMALVSGLIILVLLNTLIAWVSEGLARLRCPLWIIGVCSVGLMISLMTWIIMPWVTRVLRKWLMA